MTLHKQRQIFEKWVQARRPLCSHRFVERLVHPGVDVIMICTNCGRDAETPITMDDIPVVSE